MEKAESVSYRAKISFSNDNHLCLSPKQLDVLLGVTLNEQLSCDKTSKILLRKWVEEYHAFEDVPRLTPASKAFATQALV